MRRAYRMGEALNFGRGRKRDISVEAKPSTLQTARHPFLSFLLFLKSNRNYFVVCNGHHARDSVPLQLES